MVKTKLIYLHGTTPLKSNQSDHGEPPQLGEVIELAPQTKPSNKWRVVGVDGGTVRVEPVVLDENGEEVHARMDHEKPEGSEDPAIAAKKDAPKTAGVQATPRAGQQPGVHKK